MSSGTTAEPIQPDAPVTKTRMRETSRWSWSSPNRLAGGAAARPRRLPVELRAQANRQGLQLVGEPRLDVSRRARYLHLGEPPECLLDQDPELEARERGAQAEMTAARAERLV